MQAAVNQTCMGLIQDRWEDFNRNSGRFFDQIGYFKQCMELPDMKYTHFYFKQVSTQKLQKLFYGACVPVNCTQQQLTKEMDLILSFVPLPSKLQTAWVYENPQDYSYEYDWKFFLTITLITTLVVLCIVSTIMSKIKPLQAFNIKKSLQTFQYRHSPLNVFNGVKALSMMWVIMGHEYSIRIANSLNLITIDPFIAADFMLIPIGGFLAVDLFFFMGGFLVAYSFLRTKSKNILKYVLAIVHRLLRFWPSYFVAILLLYTVFMHTGSGSFWWQMQDPAVNPCKSFWKTLLFVDNLVDNGQNMCMGWGWYLQNDMQIYILSIFVLFIHSKSKIASHVIMLAICLFSFIFNFIQTLNHQYKHIVHIYDFAKWNQYFPNLYIKPWSRCPPYLYGLVLGMIYVNFLQIQKQAANKTKQSQILQNEEEIRQPKVPFNLFILLKQKFLRNRYFRIGFQLVGIALFLFIVLIPHSMQGTTRWPQSVQSLFLAMSPITITIGLSIFLLPSLLGLKSFVSFCLDTKYFNFAAKISFWTYLIHYMFIIRFDYSQKIDFYYSDAAIFPGYASHVFQAMLFGFLGTIIVEIPFSKLQKKFFDVIMPTKERKKQVLTQSLLSKQSGMTSTVVSNDLPDRGSINPDNADESQSLTNSVLESEKQSTPSFYPSRDKRQDE